MKFLVSLGEVGTDHSHLFAVEHDERYEVEIPVQHLISAGQSVSLKLSVQMVPEGYMRNEKKMLDARGVVQEKIKAHVDFTFEYCLLPSNRTLAQILKEVVQHGVDYPRHGANCACMDKFVFEVRNHVYRALPTEAGKSTENWEARVAGKSRISHVLKLAGRFS